MSVMIVGRKIILQDQWNIHLVHSLRTGQFRQFHHISLPDLSSRTHTLEHMVSWCIYNSGLDVLRPQ